MVKKKFCLVGIDNDFVDLIEDNQSKFVGYFSEKKRIYKFLKNRKKWLGKHNKENWYKDGLWVTWSSRMNQIKYFEKYRNHKTNYQKDGLTSLHYKLYNDYNEPDYNCTTLQVNT